MASTPRKNKEKSVDLPPTGARNPDPITDAAGAHPIEAGAGAALGGAAAGFAAGMAAGPVGAVVGAVAGGNAGGYAGKGIGELIDPTTEDEWFNEYHRTHHATARKASTPDAIRPAYHYGIESGIRHDGKRFEEVESDLRSGWEKTKEAAAMSWDKARGVVRDAFDRTIQLREERLTADKRDEKVGDVKVRKDVITEHKTLTAPVEREEVVIERRPARGRASRGGDIKAEEIRIPVKEERVNVSKESVVKEEVSVGKRKVQETKTIEGDVRREELRVEPTGGARVRGDTKAKR